MTPDAALARLRQYGERTSTWSTATHNDGTEKALHQIAVTLADEVDRLRTWVAELEDRPTRAEVLDEAAAHFDSSAEGRFVTRYFGHQVAAELKAMRVDHSVPCEEFRQDGECSCSARHTTP